MGKVIGTKQAVQQFHSPIENETEKFLRVLLSEPNRVHEFNRM